MDSRPSLVLLATDGASTRVLYRWLKQGFELSKVVLEPPLPAHALVRGRARQLGLRVAAGQVAFQVLAVPFLRRHARLRIEQIQREHGLHDEPIPDEDVTRIGSVNSAEARELLQRLDPDVVVLSGTRIVAEATLDSIRAPFLNVHTGITPKYRGIHGGYWALAQEDAGNCGVTVHVVDSGVDTGPVLGQERIHPTPADSFVTYPLLQLAAARPLLEEAVATVAQSGVDGLSPPEGESRRWWHPTLWQYLSARRRLGVR